VIDHDCLFNVIIYVFLRKMVYLSFFEK